MSRYGEGMRGPHSYRTCEETKSSITAPLRPTANLWSGGLRRVQAPSYRPLNSTAPEGFSGPGIRRGKAKKPTS